MYSRSYYGDASESINLPENYRGEAFAEGEPSPAACEDEVECAQVDATEVSANGSESVEASARPLSFFGNIFSSLGLGRLDGIKLPKIGSEELLIIAAALFLLFSKEGDRECGIMLLLLLLIN